MASRLVQAAEIDRGIDGAVLSDRRARAGQRAGRGDRGGNLAHQGMKVAVRSHPDSMYAGAIGAALWGAFRLKNVRLPAGCERQLENT